MGTGIFSLETVRRANLKVIIGEKPEYKAPYLTAEEIENAWRRAYMKNASTGQNIQQSTKPRTLICPNCGSIHVCTGLRRTGLGSKVNSLYCGDCGFLIRDPGQAFLPLLEG